jgi:hypothetical protein
MEPYGVDMMPEVEEELETVEQIGRRVLAGMLAEQGGKQ